MRNVWGSLKPELCKSGRRLKKIGNFTKSSMFFKVWVFFSSSKIGSSVIILMVDLHPWQVEESHMSPFNLWYCHLPMRQPNVDDDFEFVLPNFAVANGALVNLNNLFNCFSNLEPPPLVRADLARSRSKAIDSTNEASTKIPAGKEERI